MKTQTVIIFCALALPIFPTVHTLFNSATAQAPMLSATSQPTPSEPIDLFTAGDGGIASFRIPALITATNGTLIAVADARHESAGDLNHGKPIDIVIRRSEDNGKTWSARTFLYDFTNGKSASDPSLLLDATTGSIFCFFNVWDNVNSPGVYQYFVQRSDDNGMTWSTPREITNDIRDPSWPKKSFAFITSGKGCQTRDGMLIHTLVLVEQGVCLFGSTDHGRTWRRFGAMASPADESKIIECADGSWMINARANGGYRWVHVSNNHGASWTSKRENQLQDPSCNASLIRYKNTHTLLFSNAKSNGRRNLTIRTSGDNGKTWNEGYTVEPQGAAYSDITILKNGDIGILFETAGYKTIRYQTIPWKLLQ